MILTKNLLNNIKGTIKISKNEGLSSKTGILDIKTYGSI